mgnify:CR=1 FL=1
MIGHLCFLLGGDRLASGDYTAVRKKKPRHTAGPCDACCSRLLVVQAAVDVQRVDSVAAIVAEAGAVAAGELQCAAGVHRD